MPLRRSLPLAVALTLAAPVARAQSSLSVPFDDGFALDSFSPSTSSDRLLLVPGAHADGHLTPSARLLGVWAYRPLLRRTDRPTGEQREIVSSALTLHAGGTLTLSDLVLVHLDAPFVVAQAGEARAGNEPEGGTLGDLRAGARVRVLRARGGSPAASVGAEIGLPTGSEEHLTGDGSVRAALRASVEGRAGRVAHGASLAYVARPRTTDPSVEIGSGLSLAVGAHWVLLDDRLSAGPEVAVDARFPRDGSDQGFLSGRTTAVHGLLTAALRLRDLLVTAGLGPGLSDAPGVSPRIALGVAWAPPAEPRQGPDPDEAPADRGSLAPEPPRDREQPAAEPRSVTEPVEQTGGSPGPAPTAPAPSEQPPEPLQRAREHFARGVAAYDAGEWEKARGEFEAAYALRPHPAVLLNLAQSALRAGSLPAACEHFRKWKAEAVDAGGAEMKTVDDGIAAACKP